MERYACAACDPLKLVSKTAAGSCPPWPAKAFAHLRSLILADVPAPPLAGRDRGAWYVIWVSAEGIWGVWKLQASCHLLSLGLLSLFVEAGVRTLQGIDPSDGSDI